MIQYCPPYSVVTAVPIPYAQLQPPLRKVLNDNG